LTSVLGNLLLVATVLIQESSKLKFVSDIGMLNTRLKKEFRDATFWLRGWLDWGGVFKGIMQSVLVGLW